MSFDLGFQPCDILLPAPGIDPGRWAVIACDQYTSQKDYWEKADGIAGDAPSALCRRPTWTKQKRACPP